MKKNVVVTYLGMEGDGPNKTAAKQNAEERIEAALTGEWNPFVIVHKGLVALIARKPERIEFQWGYRIVNAAVSQTSGWLDLNYKSRPEAIRAAAYSLAQQSSTYEGLEAHLTDPVMKDLDEYFDWQAAYRLASVSGKSDEECRREADDIINKRRYKAAA